MVTVRANVRSSSPYLHSSSSPCTLSHILEQHHNQCVPGSPSLSPYFKQIAFSQRVQLTRNGSPAAAQVPEPVENASSSTANYSNGSRVYSGSPLLRQILRVGRKRQFEGENISPLTMSMSGKDPSPIAQSNKRARIDSPSMCVPNSVIITERRPNQHRSQTKGSIEQVVPGNPFSPLEVERRRGKVHGLSYGESRSEHKSWLNGCQRALPQSKEGVRALDLFAGDEIFANHEE